MRIRPITLLVLALLLCLGTPISAQRSPKVCLYCFYGVGCSACARVEPHISQLEQKYLQLEVHRFEIYGNRSNLQLLNRYFDKYGASGGKNHWFIGNGLPMSIPGR